MTRVKRRNRKWDAIDIRPMHVWSPLNFSAAVCAHGFLSYRSQSFGAKGDFGTSGHRSSTYGNGIAFDWQLAILTLSETEL